MHEKSMHKLRAQRRHFLSRDWSGRTAALPLSPSERAGEGPWLGIFTRSVLDLRTFQKETEKPSVQ